MGRCKKFNREDFVRVESDDKTEAKCLVCNKMLKLHMGNIKRHYLLIHKKDSLSNELNIPTVSKKPKLLPMVELQMNKDEYLKVISETVTHLNMPIKNFDDEVFQKLLQPWTTAYGIKFNSKTISTHLSNLTRQFRTNLSNMVKNKYICLKLDFVNGMERSLIGINIQFIENFELAVYTIGMVELLESHTAFNLKRIILDTLNQYHINMNQIYTITIDDGANVMKTPQVLQEYFEYGLTDNDNIGENIFNKFSSLISECFSVVHCAAHTLQLAFWDGIELIKDPLNELREDVKSIRKKMKELQIGPFPLLDNVTRWSSTYEMINSLIKMEDNLKANPIFKMKIDWEFVKKFQKCFKPLIEATKILQSKQLIMGDIYTEWLVCETELEELAPSNEIAKYLLEALQKRKRSLMENHAFIAALYLDPRFCYRGSIFLTEDQKEAAITHLLMIYNKLKTFGEINNHYSDLNRDESSDNLIEKYNKLEKKTAAITFSHDDFNTIQESLEQFQYGEKLPFNYNILNYWKNNAYKDFTIAKIAEVVLAIPATQVSMERTFSALPLIMTKNRRNLSSENLDDILLLKFNPNVFNKKVSIH